MLYPNVPKSGADKSTSGHYGFLYFLYHHLHFLTYFTFSHRSFTMIDERKGSTEWLRDHHHPNTVTIEGSCIPNSSALCSEFLDLSSNLT